MKTAHRVTAIIEREDDGFVPLCPEFDIAGEGASSEFARRFHREVFVTLVEVPVA